MKYFGAGTDSKGLFVSTNNIADSNREAACLDKIIKNHGNWSDYGIEYIQKYIKNAIDLGILVWSQEEKSYKGMFDF